MLVFNIINSCRMVAGNKDHYFYLEKHDQKESPPMKECWKGTSHSR